MTNKAKDVAHLLLEHEAVILNPNEPFTWASGIQSPIYCDNRQLISVPSARREVAEALATLIRTHFPDVTVVAGTATAGIPHAAWVSEILDLPMIYIRGEAKDHGRKTQVEGKLAKEDKVVIIEDLISTGGSVLDAVKAVQDDCQVLGAVAIFTYGMSQAAANFKEAGVVYHCVTDFPTLLEVAAAEERLSTEEIEAVEAWHQDFTK